MVHSIAKPQSSAISRHRFSGMFEAKLKIRQTDPMETEVGIAVFVVVYGRKFVRAFRGIQHPSKFRLNLWTSLATSLMTTVVARPRRGRWLKRTMCD